jgi:2-dehydro-3-deoxyphosphogluconate aldolase/(4S)-4-hydroxy-2-oxoglutarate aldolase
MELENRINETRKAVLADGLILAVRLGVGVDVLEACRAAARGGLWVLEITLTTPGAFEVIAELAGDENLIVGGGTVLTEKDVERVATAGGCFALSPVFDPEVTRAAAQSGLLAIPGTATPREALEAYRCGSEIVKVFPSAALGGPEYLRALRGPLPDIGLIPTSGPNAENLDEYLAAGAIAVGVGREVFAAGFTPESIEQEARKLRRAMERARVSSAS